MFLTVSLKIIKYSSKGWGGSWWGIHWRFRIRSHWLEIKRKWDYDSPWEKCYCISAFLNPLGRGCNSGVLAYSVQGPRLHLHCRKRIRVLSLHEDSEFSKTVCSVFLFTFYTTFPWGWVIKNGIYVSVLNWSVFVNLTQSRATWEVEISTEELSPDLWACLWRWWPVGIGYRGILLMTVGEGYHCGRYHPWAGAPGLDTKESWTSQRMQVSKQHCSMGSLLQF